MSLFQRGKVVLNSLSVHRCPRLGVLSAAVVAMAMLALPRPAAAHIPCCLQCVNPSGKMVPQGGDNIPACIPPSPTHGAAAECNPDGFFLVGSKIGENGTCGAEGTNPVTLKSCTQVDASTQIDDTGVFTTCTTEDGTFSGPEEGGTFLSGTLIKYIRACGAATPSVSLDQADQIDFLKASGSLEVCVTEDGTTNCIVCPNLCPGDEPLNCPSN